MKEVEHPDTPTTNVLLYGPPKSSKTTGALSAPGPILLLNADLPNATLYARRHWAFKDRVIKEVGFESFKDTMIEIGRGLADGGDMTFGGLFNKKATPLTIVVDPIAGLYRQLLEELSKRAVSPTLPTYQAVGVHVERFCRALCQSQKVNTVFVCHDLPVKDESSGEVERLPATGTNNPALGRKLMEMVDIVGFTAAVEDEESGAVKYMAQLVDGKGRRGGQRFGDALGTHREINLAEWFALGKTPAEEPEKEAVAA